MIICFFIKNYFYFFIKMSSGLPDYLKFLNVYDDFYYLYNNKKDLFYNNGQNVYINEEGIYDYFDKINSIMTFLKRISLSISNKGLFDFCINDVYTYIPNEIEININKIYDLKIDVEKINKKIISSIMYVSEYITYRGVEFYKIDDVSSILYDFEIVDKIVKNLYDIVLYFSYYYYTDNQNSINNKNKILYIFMLSVFQQKNLDITDYNNSIINNYVNYIFYENYLQSLIFNGLFLQNKTKLFKDIDIIEKYIKQYIKDFDPVLLIDFITNYVNKLENRYLNNKNVEYFINQKIINTQCNLNEKEIKKMIQIIFDNYILKYNYIEFYTIITDKLYDEIFKYACGDIDKNELNTIIDGYTNDMSDIIYIYTSNFIQNNDNIFLFKYSSIVKSLSQFLFNVLDNNEEDFFKYIEILSSIFNYKKELIQNGFFSIKINKNLNKIIKSCIDNLCDIYNGFKIILKKVNKNSLIFSFYDSIEFIVIFFEKLLSIVNVSNDILENTREYILFDDLKIKNVFSEKYKKEVKDIKYYLYYFDDIKRLHKFIKNDDQFLSKVNNDNFYGNLKINFTPYYEFYKTGISITNYTQLKLKINNFEKNIIMLGEYHTKKPYNYQYIQNELYLCKKQNKYIEFLIEINIELLYDFEFKQRSKDYRNNINLLRYSPCVSDKTLKNVYSDISENPIDNIFCFDNIWYQNIDYRTSDLIFSYIYNSNFNQRAKERIILEKNYMKYFDDIDGLYLGHFYYKNSLEYLNYTYKNFLSGDKYVLFNHVYEFSINDPLYKVLDFSINLNDFKISFKERLKKLAIKYNQKLSDIDDKIKSGDIVLENYIYYLNLFIKKNTNLYKNLYNDNPIFNAIDDFELNELFKKIDNIQIFDIYKIIVLQITDYYNYVFNTYVNIDEKVEKFIFTDPINIYGYRTYKFINNFVNKFDKNAIKNIIICTMIRYISFEPKKYEYNDIISSFLNYDIMFCKLSYINDDKNLMIRDSFIDINILNRIFFEYDVDDKVKNHFPEKCNNILIYAGETHTIVILTYLTNSLNNAIYRNIIEYDLVLDNIGKYNGPLISYDNFITIGYGFYMNEKISLPSICLNFE